MTGAASRLAAPVVVATLLLAGPSGRAADWPPSEAGPRLARLERELAVLLESTAEPAAAFGIAEELRSIRSAVTFAEAGRLLRGDPAPARILSVGGGAHLGPLALCEELPAGRPCTLEITDVDPSTQRRIEEALRRVEARSALAVEGSTREIADDGGRREWLLLLSGHPVRLVLSVPPPQGRRAPRLFDPARLSEFDLLVAHDLASDPLAVLAIVLELLTTARGRVPSCIPPPLLVEDASAHPYPVDLVFFEPIARIRGPFGHRAPRRLPGGTRVDESGVSLFGGAVLLGFRQTWWQDVDEADLVALLDFLLLSAFDDGRRNVLEGGEAPLLVPEEVDRWTGFGGRLLRGRRLEGTAGRLGILRAVDRVRAALPGVLQERIGCHLALYRQVLAATAEGREAGPLPGLSGARILRPGEGGPPALEALLEKAAAGELRRVGEPGERAVRSREVLAAASVLAPSNERCPLVALRPRVAPGELRRQLLEALRH